jgi:hypothetical protein
MAGRGFPCGAASGVSESFGLLTVFPEAVVPGGCAPSEPGHKPNAVRRRSMRTRNDEKRRAFIVHSFHETRRRNAAEDESLTQLR